MLQHRKPSKVGWAAAGSGERAEQGGDSDDSGYEPTWKTPRVVLWKPRDVDSRRAPTMRARAFCRRRLMPAYSFEAIDQQGQPRKGVLEADTARGARGLLRAQALIPLSVTRGRQRRERRARPAGGWRRLLGGGRVFNSTTPRRLDAADRRPGVVRPAARTRAHRADRRSRNRAAAQPGRLAARRGQCRLALRHARWRSIRASSRRSTPR